MKNYTIIYFIPLLFFLLFFSNEAFSQAPNLVPNSSFENGSQAPNYWYATNWATTDINGLYNWEIGYYKINIGGGCLGNNGTGPNAVLCDNTTCWLDYNNFALQLSQTPYASPIWPNPVYNSYTSKCLHLDKQHDIIRVGLISPVTAWKTYTIRIKIFCYEAPAELNVYLTHWGLHWNSKKADNHKIHVTSFNPAVKDFTWTGYQATFTTDQDMENLVLEVKQGEILIDDVEITEGGGCPNLLLQQNKNYYTTEPTYEAYDIRAGSDVGDVNGIGPVTVRNPGGHITYKAAHQISLKPGFSVEAGAYFHAYIAPCGKECFSPIAITSDVNDNGDDLCGIPVPGTTYPLGSSPIDGMSYVWTASPTSALANLSATNISNPVFSPPTSGYGTITYTLTVTNACAEVTSSALAINYSTQGAMTGVGYIYTVSETSTSTVMSLSNSYGAGVSEIGIDVYNPSYAGIKRSFLLKRGIDFDGAYNTWYYPYPGELACNSIHYPIKLYYKTYCDDNWYPCSGTCPTDFFAPGDCLRMNQLDSTVVQENPTSLIETNTAIIKESMLISPNPNKGSFKITVTKNGAAIGVKEVKVYDMVGKIIWENKTPSSNIFNVDISSYSQGIYYVRVINESGDIEMKKLLKQ